MRVRPLLKSKFTVYPILFFASFNTVLRLSIDSNWTLFRLIFPLLIPLILLNKRPAIFKKRILVLLGLFIYGLIAGLSSRFTHFNVTFTANYLLLAVFLILTTDISIINSDLIYKFLRFLFYIVLLLAVIEIYTSFHLPNTNYRPHEVVAFFWNGNESSAFIASTSIVLYLKERKRMLPMVYLIIGFAFSYYNSARLTMAATLIFLLYVSFKKLTTRLHSHVPQRPVMYISLFSLLFLLFIYAPEEFITFLSTIVFNMFTGDVFYNVGSIFNRINALTLGFYEFLCSFGLGIGPGNSRIFMEEIIVPGTEKFTAYSMHNALAQFLVEYGYFAILLMGLLYNRFKIVGVKLGFFHYLMILLAFIISSITSGFHSNFALVLSLSYLIIISFKKYV